MTVHGSKGLQAPIVILADATDDPRPRRLSFDLSMSEWEKLPVFALGKDERHGAIARAGLDGESRPSQRSEEHTSELQSLMRTSYAVFCLKKKTKLSYMHVPRHQYGTQ